MIRILFLLLLLPSIAMAQTATLTGTVRSTTGRALEFIRVSVSGEDNSSATTDPEGKYRLTVPAGRSITILFSDYQGELSRETPTLAPGETRVLDKVLQTRYNELQEFVKKEVRPGDTDPGGIGIINPRQANELPSTSMDPIADFIKMQTGGGRSELSNQYTVRGGNYDENLVYVNDFEIQRPFLVRSGQQEGLGFVNSDLAGNVYFSVGGFQPRYGDKMSSVLDVTYKRPTRFAGSVMGSLLGGTMHLEGASRNKKLSYLFGARQKSNQYILQAQPTKGVYNPTFTDVQALLNYRLNVHWEIEAIGNYARNRFSFEPERSVSAFGVIDKVLQLETFYSGKEIDRFDSRFAGISTTYRPNPRMRLKFLASGFQTDEQETYDISGEYLFSELETDLGKTNFGQPKYYLGTGVITQHARNYLKVNVGTIAHRGWLEAGKGHFLQWGLDASTINIKDKLYEWERRDSAGFTQPYDPNANIYMAKFYRSANEFSYQRYSGFLQDAIRFGDSVGLTITGGIRFNYSTLNGELLISPRAQATYLLNRNNILKLAAGLYGQPPFYRELRDLNGNVNTSVKAQKSVHIVAGTEHNFKWGTSPIRLTTEAYYKRLTDLIPYEYDNVRIRYFGRNNANGYAYGGEVRLYGDLVKDATSWVSVGFLKTEEDLTDDKIVYKNELGADSATFYPGYIPRPTDQRAMFGMYFQDYLPRNKNFKAHLNLIYSTGLPFGPPDQQRYGDTLRLPDYKRVDVGFSALLLDGARKNRPAYSLFNNVESIWASLEIFNLIGLQNTISYTWVQDQSSGRVFAVPNRLTARLVNVKLIVKF